MFLMIAPFNDNTYILWVTLETSNQDAKIGSNPHNGNT